MTVDGAEAELLIKHSKLMLPVAGSKGFPPKQFGRGSNISYYLGLKIYEELY